MKMRTDLSLRCQLAYLSVAVAFRGRPHRDPLADTAEHEAATAALVLPEMERLAACLDNRGEVLSVLQAAAQMGEDEHEVEMVTRDIAPNYTSTPC